MRAGKKTIWNQLCTCICLAVVAMFMAPSASANGEPYCPEDLNGDFVVDTIDLLNLLGAWGPCAGCDQDLNNDNVVDTIDLLALLGAWGDCPVCGNPTSGSCFVNNGTPGCSDSTCCEKVCALDPFCCSTLWDNLCAGDALEQCQPQACCFGDQSCAELLPNDCIEQGGTPQGVDSTCDSVLCPNAACPGEGNCFEANSTVGCNDEACCNLVCASDSFCCDTEWDGLCADAANDLCGSESCPGEGDCFSANGTVGCDDQACCNTVCLLDPFCCDTEWDSTCAEEAFIYCNHPACGTGGSCFFANTTPGCNDGECCSLVCAEDPFCCETEWDGLCAEAAGELCKGDPCPGEGNCFLPNGTVGCNDEECCNIVCTEDQFCCDTEWDELCADSALKNCAGNAACPGDGACLEANGSVGCDDQNCCNIVCAFDSFCCETAWDILCALYAGENCDGGNKACPGEGSCFEANGTVGCDDTGCCNVVCFQDSFCCETEWDELCAEDAQEDC